MLISVKCSHIRYAENVLSNFIAMNYQWMKHEWVLYNNLSAENIVSINDNLKSMPQTHGHHEVNSCQAYCFYIY